MSAGRPARRHFLLKFQPEFHPARKRVDESLPPLLAGGMGRLQRRTGERRIVLQPGSDEKRGGPFRQLDLPSDPLYLPRQASPETGETSLDPLHEPARPSVGEEW